MTSNEIAKNLVELNALIKELRYREALDKFYSEDIISIENESPPLVGLSAYKARAEIYLQCINKYSAELISVIVSEDISVTEWRYRFNHSEWGLWDKVQVSVQRWKDGKIIHERHHYKD